MRLERKGRQAGDRKAQKQMMHGGVADHAHALDAAQHGPRQFQSLHSLVYRSNGEVARNAIGPARCFGRPPGARSHRPHTCLVD